MNIFIKTILITFTAILLFSVNVSCFATEAQMKSTLVQIINQLQALKPLINQAQAEQPKNPRIKIHFDSWRDAQGKKHNGLRQDIEQIQQALITTINKQSIEPRSYTPIANDFTGDSYV